MKIVIVGGGTAGWTTALLLSSLKGRDYDITLIADEDIGIIGVGESTTVAITDLIDKCCGDWSDFWHKTGSMPKLVKKFVNWDGKGTEFYCPIDGSVTQSLDIDHFSYYLLKEGKDTSLSAKCRILHENRKIDFGLDGEMRRPLPALHMDTHLTVEYLKEKCLEKGVRYICGTVEKIFRREDNKVKGALVNTEHNYESVYGDFWFDASGQKRILSNDVPFVSFKKYLPVNRAISTVIERRGDYVAETTSTALSAGWAWDIPTATRSGVGYVYCSDYMSDEEAVEEFNKHFGTEIETFKHHSFESGMLQTVWNDNVLSIGLCSGFLEPLQATSIHTTIVETSLFATKYLRETIEETCQESEMKEFNTFMNKIMIDFRDLVNLNYSGGGPDTEFWKNIQLTDRSKSIIKSSSSRVLLKKDFDIYYGSAGIGIWMTILMGLNHVPLSVIDELEKRDPNWYSSIKEQYSKFDQYMKSHLTNCLNNSVLENN